MRVLITGGRDYKNRQRFNRYLDQFHWKNTIDLIIHGDCPTGADTLANDWATVNRVDCLPIAADWKKHGKSAGPIRNRLLVDEGHPDVVIAFPGNTGTRDMITYARTKNIHIIEVEDEDARATLTRYL